VKSNAKTPAAKKSPLPAKRKRVEKAPSLPRKKAAQESRDRKPSEQSLPCIILLKFRILSKIVANVGCWKSKS